ncbi:uncharacterized protein NPIL_299541 [Nephila pilipes]|uniref:Uncharacterized protein n=1 Tax=Nephila pilipes TaxID=299642 RepID=A0A8X6T5K8_NEPPI|nr:uncharacterized protein NPIL_299541 [Nephila pilipes]
MAMNNEIRSVAEFVLSFVFYKYKIIDKEPELELPAESKINDFISDLKNIVWVESHFAMAEWDQFLKNNCSRMTSSRKLYATYVIFACYLKNEENPIGFRCFLQILTTVASFAIYASQMGFSRSTDVSAEIIEAFYGKEIEKKINDQGGWKDFSEFVKHRPSLNTLEIFNDEDSIPRNPSKTAFELNVNFQRDYKINGHVLVDISEDTVENDLRTNCLVKTIKSLTQETTELITASKKPEEVQE